MNMRRDVSPTVFDMRHGSREVIELVAEKWRVLVISAIYCDVKRHGEMRRQIKGISQKMLTQTLRNLERDGLIERTVIQKLPLHVEYNLTPLGQTFGLLVRDICIWADEHYDELKNAQMLYDREHQ